MFKNTGIKAKFEIYILSACFVIFISLLSIFFYFNQKIIQEEAVEKLKSETSTYANWNKIALETAVFSARDLSLTILTLKHAEKPDRFLAQEMCKKMIIDNPDYVSVWATFDKNSFDGLDSNYTSGFDHSNNIGRFASGYYKDNGEIKISPATDESEVLEADYYNLPKDSKKEVVLEPYYYSYTGNKADEVLETSICVPFFDNEKFIGVAGIDISLQTLINYNNKVKVYETGFGQLLSNTGIVVVHSDTSRILKPCHDLEGNSKEQIIESIKNGNPITIEEYSDSLKTIVYKVFSPIKIGRSDENWSYCIIVPKDEVLAKSWNSFYKMLIFAIFSLIILTIIIRTLLAKIIKPIQIATKGIQLMGQGVIDNEAKLEITSEDELGQMAKAVNKLIDGLQEKSNFAIKIGTGDLNTNFTKLSEQDKLGDSLLEMRESLLKAEKDDLERKKEDDRRNWATTGISKFAEILRQNNDNMEQLSFNVIKNIIDYTGMNQGGVFILNNNNSDHHFLEMTACYAFDRRKFQHKIIEIGEGLVGACFQEGKTIYLTQVPNEYINITSGLGEANPNCVLIVPLKLNETIFGIIECASFKKLEPFQIEFIERIAESIASTISTVKINLRTAQLLETSQQQAEEMRAQEEEMRQNMEEMHATQEEMGRKESMMNATVEKLKKEIEELKKH